MKAFAVTPWAEFAFGQYMVDGESFLCPVWLYKLFGVPQTAKKVRLKAYLEEVPNSRKVWLAFWDHRKFVLAREFKWSLIVSNYCSMKGAFFWDFKEWLRGRKDVQVKILKTKKHSLRIWVTAEWR